MRDWRPGSDLTSSKATPPKEGAAAGDGGAATRGQADELRGVMGALSGRGQAGRGSTDTSEGAIHRMADGDAQAGASEAAFDAAQAGSTASLPYKAEMERAFGQNFSDVNVFLGRGEALRPLGAKAATRANTIVFGNDNPNALTVAHELTHVVQARQATGAPGAGLSQPGDHSEVEAESLADAVARGYKVDVQQKPSAGVSRTTVYRGMNEAGGKPAIGQDANSLGVRVGTDVTVTNEGGTQMVAADGKGMSTAMGSPRNLPEFRRSKEWGGTKSYPVWSIDDGTFTATGVLKPVADGGNHVSITAKAKCTLAAYEGALNGTQSSWAKVPPPKPGE